MSTAEWEADLQLPEPLARQDSTNRVICCKLKGWIKIPKDWNSLTIMEVGPGRRAERTR